jgi:hypothetical protein
MITYYKNTYYKIFKHFYNKMPLSRKYCRSKKRKSKSHKYICKKYKLLKRSKKTCRKTCRKRSRKDYGNIFGKI